MRVLVFMPCFTRGGAEKQAMILARWLVELGHTVEAWGFPTSIPTDPVIDSLTASGIGCTQLSAWPNLNWTPQLAGGRTQLLLTRYWSWPRQLRRFAQLIPEEKFDVIIPFTFWPSLVSSIYRDKLGASIVFWNHRGGNDDAGIKYDDFIVRRIVQANPLFIANSSDGKLFLKRTFRLSNESVKVIGNAFEPDTPDPRESIQLDNTKGHVCQLVQLANHFPEKDFETLLLAARDLVRLQLPFHLHLAGSFPDSSIQRQFSGILEEMHISDHVTHHGSLDNQGVATLLAQSDIGILSSRSEGCPNSIMEYMHWGLPVVGTSIAGIRDLVGLDGERYLFSVGDVNALVSILGLLIRSKTTRLEAGSKNQLRLNRSFSKEVILKQWLDILPVVTEGAVA